MCQRRPCLPICISWILPPSFVLLCCSPVTASTRLGTQPGTANTLSLLVGLSSDHDMEILSVLQRESATWHGALQLCSPCSSTGRITLPVSRVCRSYLLQCPVQRCLVVLSLQMLPCASNIARSLLFIHMAAFARFTPPDVVSLSRHSLNMHCRCTSLV